MNRHTLSGTIAIVTILLPASFAQSDRLTPRVDRMTCAQAKARIPDRSLPDFWVGDVKGLASRFEHLEHGTLHADVWVETAG